MEQPQLTPELQEYMEKQMAPIREKMLEQEEVNHKKNMDENRKDGKEISALSNNFKSQLITLEGVIFGAVVVFLGSQTTIWLVLGLIFLVVSIIFGIWSQKLYINGQTWLQRFNYNNLVRGNWWTRELWGDKNVKSERDLVEPNLEDPASDNTLLQVFRLNADKVEKAFVITFIVALIALIIHFISRMPFPIIRLPHLKFPALSLGYLFSNSTVQLLGVVGTLGATYFSAKSAGFAKASIDEMKRQKEPRVILFVKQIPGDIFTVYLVVKNEGRSAARDISFTVNGNLNVLGERDIAEVAFLQNGVHVLSEGQEISNPIGILIGEQYANMISADCSVEVRYKDSDDKVFVETYKLDFKSLTDRQLGTPKEDKLISALEDISSSLEKIRDDIEVGVHKVVPPRPQHLYGDDSTVITGKLDPNGVTSQEEGK